jgi:dTDP-4-dehydrorhamnose reductase
MSKARFGLRLAEALGLSTAAVRIGSVEDVKLAARRPRDMRMATALAQEVLGRAPETVDEAISRLAAEWRKRTVAVVATHT